MRDISSEILNIRHFTEKIRNASREAIDAQLKAGNETTDSLRLLGGIDASCNWIENYCDNIKSYMRFLE